MSIVAITGNHPRHIYMVQQLAQAGILVGWIIEQREAFVPTPPAELSDDLTYLFNLHFRRREEAEGKFFGDASTPRGIPILETSMEDLNSRTIVDFLRKQEAKLVLSYGCHKLSDEMMNETGATFWNTHGGLSPQYRGVTTHFWPSYLLEPQMTGMTLHETTSKIDGGGIIHQTGVSMVKGDKLHELAGRAVREYSDALPSLLKHCIQENFLPNGIEQKTTGKIWTSIDWRPEHLVSVYRTYEDRIVDMVVDGEIKGREPKLISAL